MRRVPELETSSAEQKVYIRGRGLARWPAEVEGRCEGRDHCGRLSKEVLDQRSCQSIDFDRKDYRGPRRLEEPRLRKGKRTVEGKKEESPKK